MGPLRLPSDFQVWPQIKVHLGDLYHRLINQSIHFLGVCEVVEVIHTRIDVGGSEDLATDPHSQGSKDTIENVESGLNLLDPSNVWCVMQQAFRKMDKKKQDHFLYFTLPGIVHLSMALDDATEEEKQGWCQQQQGNCDMTLSRQFVSTVVACLFLQLFPKENGYNDLLKQQFIDGSAIDSILDYFDWVIKCGMRVGGQLVILTKTLCYGLWMDFDCLIQCDLALCPLTLVSGDQTESIKDDAIDVNFWRRATANPRHEENRDVEENLIGVYPELLAVMMRLGKMELAETVVISGLETYSGMEQHGEEQVVLCKRTPDRLVLMDPGSCWNEEMVDSQQHHQDSAILQALNSTLWGFYSCALSHLHMANSIRHGQGHILGSCVNPRMSAANVWSNTKQSHYHPNVSVMTDSDVTCVGRGVSPDASIPTRQHDELQRHQLPQQDASRAPVRHVIPTTQSHQTQDTQSLVSSIPSILSSSSSPVSSSRHDDPSRHHRHGDTICSYTHDAPYPHPEQISSLSSLSPWLQSSSSSHPIPVTQTSGASTHQQQTPDNVFPRVVTAITSHPHSSSSFQEDKIPPITSQTQETCKYWNTNIPTQQFAKSTNYSEDERQSENSSSALFNSISSPEISRNKMEERIFLWDLLGNLTNSSSGALSVGRGAGGVPVENTCVKTPFQASSSPLVCDNPEENMALTPPVPLHPGNGHAVFSDHCDNADDIAAVLNPSPVSSIDFPSLAGHSNIPPEASNPRQDSPLPSSTSSPLPPTSPTLPPLSIDIPTLSSHPDTPSLQTRAGDHSPNRKSPRSRSNSQQQQQQLLSSKSLELPMSSMPHTSASPTTTSPNSSLVFSDPSHKDNVNTMGSFDMPTMDEIPGNMDAILDFLSSSSSSMSVCSGGQLGQGVPSSSGCSRWGSRSGSVSSHGTNGSSNDFVEFWNNFRRRSSQLSDASRRSSSSKHSSDFSTDLEDISENFSKHSHDIIEEEGLVNVLSEFACQVVNAAIHVGTLTSAKVIQDTHTVDGTDIKEVDGVCDTVLAAGGLDSKMESFPYEKSSGASPVQEGGRGLLTEGDGKGCRDFKGQEGDGLSVEGLLGDNTSREVDACVDKEHKSLGLDERAGYHGDSTLMAGGDATNSIVDSVSSFSSPVEKLSSTSMSINIPSHTTVKDMPPSHSSFSPPQRVQTLELRNVATSFAVLESKVVYFKEDTEKQHFLSPSQAPLTESLSNAESIGRGKSVTHSSVPHKKTDMKRVSASSAKEEPPHPPHSAHRSLLKPPSISSRRGLGSKPSASNRSDTISAPTTLLWRKCTSSPSHVKKTDNSSRQQTVASSKMSNIPKFKNSGKTTSSTKVSSCTPKPFQSTTKAGSTSWHSKHKDRNRSPICSRYLVSDVAAPLKVKTKYKRTATSGRGRRSKESGSIKKSQVDRNESKRMVSKPVPVDVTQWPQFWHFVNILTEQTVSQAVLEAAEESVTTHTATNGDNVEELSDEVYNWFADKIVHQVFFRVVESLETRNNKCKSDSENVDTNSEVTSWTDIPCDLTFSRCSHDGVTRSNDFLSSILSKGFNEQPSFPPSPPTSSKPGIQRQKSVSSLSSGRISSFNKTVSFDDSVHEPIRTGSEGDLSRHSSFYYSDSFDNHHWFHERPRLASFDRQENLRADILSPYAISRRDSSISGRIHRRLSKSTTDLPRCRNLGSFEFCGEGSLNVTNNRPYLRGAADTTRRENAAWHDMVNRRSLMRNNEHGMLESLVNTAASSPRGSLSNLEAQPTNVDSARRGSLTNTDLCVDIYQAAVAIVNQVFSSIAETIDLEALKLEDSDHNAFLAGGAYPNGQYGAFSSNIFSSSTKKTTPSSPKRSHRSMSPNVGVFSRKPMSRESLTNAFLKVDSHPSVQNYERRSSEPCHTSVQLSLEVFNKNRYSYKPSEEAQQTACTDDDIGRSCSSRISWRRGSLDNFSFESHRSNMCGFKDPVLSRFAEELMKADTSVPELVIVGSDLSSSTFGSRRSSISGFRDTTLANLESELLNTSFTSVNSLPMSQSPRSQGGHSQAKMRSRSCDRSHMTRSDSSDTEHWFPPPRIVGEEFQLEFNRQHSQGQEEDFASFFAGCVVQEAVCVIKSDPDYQTGSEQAISLYAENLTDQILRDAFLSTQGQRARSASPVVDSSDIRSNGEESWNYRMLLEGSGHDEWRQTSLYSGQGARPKLKSYSPSPSTHIPAGKRITVVGGKRSSGKYRRGNDSASSDGFACERMSRSSSQIEKRRKRAEVSTQALVRCPRCHGYHLDGGSLCEGSATGKVSHTEALAIRSMVQTSGRRGSRQQQYTNRKYLLTSAVTGSKGQMKPTLSGQSCSSGENAAKPNRKTRPGEGGTRIKHSRVSGGGVGKAVIAGYGVVDDKGILGSGGKNDDGSRARSRVVLPVKTVTKTRSGGPTTPDEEFPDFIDNDDSRGIQGAKVRQERRRDDSPDSLSSSSTSSSILSGYSDDTESSLISGRDSDYSPDRRENPHGKRKLFTRQNALPTPSSRSESKGVSGTWSHRVKVRHSQGQRQRSPQTVGALGSSVECDEVDHFASSLSHRIVRDALEETENMPWWRWFPLSHRMISVRNSLDGGPGGTGVMGSQLMLVVQWIAATLTRCPGLIWAGGHGCPGMEEADSFVRLMSGWSVRSLASAIQEYCRHVQSTSFGPAFAFTTSTTNTTSTVSMTDTIVALETSPEGCGLSSSSSTMVTTEATRLTEDVPGDGDTQRPMLRTQPDLFHFLLQEKEKGKL